MQHEGLPQSWRIDRRAAADDQELVVSAAVG